MIDCLNRFYTYVHPNGYIGMFQSHYWAFQCSLQLLWVSQFKIWVHNSLYHVYSTMIRQGFKPFTSYTWGRHSTNEPKAKLFFGKTCFLFAGTFFNRPGTHTHTHAQLYNRYTQQFNLHSLPTLLQLALSILLYKSQSHNGVDSSISI